MLPLKTQSLRCALTFLWTPCTLMSLLLSTALLTMSSFPALWSFFLFPALALLQGSAAKPWAAVLAGDGVGPGHTQHLPGTLEPLCLLSLVKKQGFPCLNLSGQGSKQKEGAELCNELIRGGMACRKGCVYNREQTLLGAVFNIWFAEPHSLEACSNFVHFQCLPFSPICPNLCVSLYVVLSSCIQPSFYHSHHCGLWAASFQPVLLKFLGRGAPVRQQLIPVSVICLSPSIASYNKPRERDINDECRLITQESVENCIKMAQQ